MTGGASGIGAATVARLRDRGARVAVLDLQAQEGQGDLAVKCDVGDEDQVVAAVQQVVDELGPLDVAVLAAGIGGMTPILDLSTEEWDRVMRVNLRGGFLCLREARGRWWQRAGPGPSSRPGPSRDSSPTAMAHYSASKAAVPSSCASRRGELGPHGIRVNGVAPGHHRHADVRGHRPAPRLPRAGRGAGGARPRRHGGRGRQAIVALFELDWVTGHMLVADGGVSLRSPIDPTDMLEGV